MDGDSPAVRTGVAGGLTGGTLHYIGDRLWGELVFD